MTFPGQRPSNHPQQVRQRGALDTVDDRATPARLFAAFSAEFGGFDIDVAASAQNRKVERYYDRAIDGLAQPWAPNRIWCNPPWSDIPAWVAKAWSEWRDGARLIVMLLPANRCEQPWWQDLVEPHRDRGGPLTTRFLRRRVEYLAPDGVSHGAGFGSLLLIWSQP